MIPWIIGNQHKLTPTSRATTTRPTMTFSRSPAWNMQGMTPSQNDTRTALMPMKKGLSWIMFTTIKMKALVPWVLKRSHTSTVKIVALLLNADERDDIRAAIMTAIIKPTNPIGSTFRTSLPKFKHKNWDKGIWHVTCSFIFSQASNWVAILIHWAFTAQ